MKIGEFREKLRGLKEAILNSMVYKGQDVKMLNIITSELRQEYKNLRGVLDTSVIPEDERRILMYYLRRDLLMFPFTLDEKRINSLPEKNSMEQVEYGA